MRKVMMALVMLVTMAAPAMAQERYPTSTLGAQIKCQELGAAKDRTPRNQEAERKMTAGQPFQDHFYRAFYSRKSDRCLFLSQSSWGSLPQNWTLSWHMDDGIEGDRVAFINYTQKNNVRTYDCSDNVKTKTGDCPENLDAYAETLR